MLPCFFTQLEDLVKPRMTILAGAAALVALAGPALAQQSQEQLKAKLEKKKKAPWITVPNWETDYDKARQQGKESGKAIFGYFTRSYAF